MDAIKQEQLVSRSKSTGFLDKVENEYDFKCFSARFCGYIGTDNRHASVSSVEPGCECGGAESPAGAPQLDSGVGGGFGDSETLLVLEHKIDKVSELLQEQQNLLMCIKEKINNSNTRRDHPISGGVIHKERDSRTEELISANVTTKVEATCDDSEEASGARSLLDAIELKHDMSLDHIIRLALENFLQSDTVKEHVARTTAECVRAGLQGSFCRAVSAAYLPLVQRSHRRLVSHVTKLLDNSFADLEESTASWFKCIHKSSRNIRTSLEKHQSLLEATDPVKNITLLRTTLKGVLEDELRTWRGRVVQELTQGAGEGGGEEPDDCAPASPMQPPNPDSSVIDTLMKCAVIKKHIEDGDVAGAFEQALSAADLALVTAACRAARPPAAAALRPAALLALLQQLATDMLHDTQLKCRYLEEAILRLDKCDAATREHLPLVVREVRQHLTQFLASYPKHHASRRVALIVMAANNLT